MSKKNLTILIWFVGVVFLLQSCKKQESEKPMQLLDSFVTGIDFINQLTFDKDFNGFNYRNYYNGGGVAIGDINNDGLADIYFTANLEKNRLYLNRGNFKFEDITETSNTGGNSSWSTGVSMVDINSDGLLDIYVCNSGDVRMANKKNELFINNGDLTFTESALRYNLADMGFGTHASFFDYDKDGDLDAYLLNNSYKPLAAFDQRQNLREKRNRLGGDKLMKNEGNIFLDTSEEAGIYGSEIGFGLGVAIGDINGDQWDDIYVSNDFFERDYLYINQKDGTFSEELTDYFQSISLNSMGADLADINNDGKNDLFVTNMLPRENARIKSKTTFMDWNKAAFNQKYGYHNQFSRNVLQMSSPEGYQEVGRYMGIEATDWSWGALIFDLDNDGLKDIFVANGIYQDLTDQDYINYISNETLMKGLISEKGFDYDKLSKQIPSSPIANNFFQNEGNALFVEAANEFGLDLKGFSNGAAYGDLDNDGDLDLVLNNVNGTASIYKNNTTGNSVSIILKGETNTFGIGSRITIKSGSETYYYEQQPVRGFQSCMDTKIVAGLKDDTPVEIKVFWPQGKVSLLKEVDVNQTIEIKESEAKFSPSTKSLPTRTKIFQPVDLVEVSHKENRFVDFDTYRFLYHMQSTKGPKLALADWNQDNENDLFVGGAKGQSSQIVSLNGKDILILPDSESEVTDAIFLDVDNDDDLDLIVANGGIEFEKEDSLLIDALYLNNNGILEKNEINPFGELAINTSCLVGSDFDGDGDIDIFLGEGLKAMEYGLPSDGYLFENDGNGMFREVTSKWMPDLKNIGMITDAEFADINNDGKPDLIVTGQFMGIHCFLNTGKQFKPVQNGLENLKGWWNKLHVTDLDLDGDLDIVAGNHGLNSTFKGSEEQPISLFVDDFDNNGFVDPVLTNYNKSGQAVPFAIRNDLIDQMASLKKIFPDYKSFESATVQTMFSKEQLDNSLELKATHLASMLFINNGDGTFEQKNLSQPAQLAPIFAIASKDFNGDGKKDLVLGGNLFGVKPQAGRYDATSGLFLKQSNDLDFVEVDCGFRATGETRDIIISKETVIVGRNNDTVLFFENKKAVNSKIP